MTEPGTGPVPVPDFTGGSGTGSGAKFISGRVLVWMHIFIIFLTVDDVITVPFAYTQHTREIWYGNNFK